MSYHLGPEMNRTSGCNQAIMFITDGIEGEYAGKKSFETNNKEKRVRVFSYLVGRMKSPDNDALIKMACENRGHFYTIDTIGKSKCNTAQHTTLFQCLYSVHNAGRRRMDVKMTFCA